MKTRLGEILKERNMSGSELARRLGVSSAYINMVVNGTVNISLKQLERIATELDISIPEFFDERDTINKPCHCPHCGGKLVISITKA